MLMLIATSISGDATACTWGTAIFTGCTAIFTGIIRSGQSTLDGFPAQIVAYRAIHLPYSGTPTLYRAPL